MANGILSQAAQLSKSFESIQPPLEQIQALIQLLIESDFEAISKSQLFHILCIVDNIVVKALRQ